MWFVFNMGVSSKGALSISNLPEMQKVSNTHNSWSTCDFEQLCPATDLVQHAQPSNASPRIVKKETDEEPMILLVVTWAFEKCELPPPTTFATL